MPLNLPLILRPEIYLLRDDKKSSNSLLVYFYSQESYVSNEKPYFFFFEKALVTVKGLKVELLLERNCKAPTHLK